MSEAIDKSPWAQLSNILIRLLQSQWLEVLVEAWKTGRKLVQGMTEEGIYEVLEYDCTLELLDSQGEQAIFRKRQKVRYLQNNILAYQDQAWGDGEILLDYKCSPGVPVDKYRPGQKTYILISLREVKDRGDIDEFHIEWKTKGGFLRETELWETEISHRTRYLKVQVIFPQTRPPLRVWLIEDASQKTYPLGEEAQVKLPDGRWQVSWEKSNPKLYGRYTLKWEW